jgi:hypothetical protein
MLQFENIETRLLIEILTGYTEKFAQLFRLHKRTHPSKEYLRCKYTIEAIINALSKRDEPAKEIHITKYEEVCLSGL